MQIPGRKQVELSGPSVPPPDLGSQQALGLRFDRQRAEIRVAAVAFPPLFRHVAPWITSVASAPIPSALLRQLHAMETESWVSSDVKSVRQEICDLASAVIEKLLFELEDTALALGSHGTGVWLGGNDKVDGSYLELLDPAKLAERFGITIVCDFPSRDLARSGTAVPVETHGLGLLLADRDPSPGYRWRGVVEISEVAHAFYAGSPTIARSTLRRHVQL